MSYETGQPIFKDYILKSPIGEGGFGRVYLVESPNGIRFALKVLHRGVEMERRGVESVKGISSDYLVRVLDYGETVAGQPCILMEYYKDNLRSVVDAGKVDEERACRCFEHILKGLMVLERHGVMHRDIKPENLFIREGNVKIGDFGTARYTAGDTSHKSHVIGTIQYMAPERFSEKYGHAVDRWAAAAVFYRLLTGKYPFKGKDRTQIFAAILRDEPDLAVVPEKYRGFLGKCFNKDEEHRHGTTQEMLADFKNVGKKKPPKPKPKSEPEPKARKIDPGPARRNGGINKFRTLIVVGLIGIFLAGGGYSLWLASQNGGDNGPSGQTEQAKYSLVVNTTPADAAVKLINAGKNYSPGVQLAPGSYKIEVSKEGFESKTEEVVITDSERKIRVALQKLKYPLTIKTTPEDAQVRIANIDRRYSPGMKLEPGRYHVEATRDGYEPRSEWVEIKDEALVHAVELTPEEKTYGLTVEPTPSDATVKIMNITPKYHPGIQLEPGRYNILVEHNDYKTYREWIAITDQDRDLKIELEKLPEPKPVPAPKPSVSASVELRSEPITTEDKDKFVLKEVENDYVNNGDGTITDRATGLMWEKSGSKNYIPYEKALAYVEELNQKRFSGHNDWRLPTVDELWSLMEKEKMNGDLYIDPIFDATQRWCWSADKRSSGSAWVVYFNVRNVDPNLLAYLYYVRCVRSGQY